MVYYSTSQLQIYVHYNYSKLQLTSTKPKLRLTRLAGIQPGI